MRPALISGGASGKKVSIHFQCFDPRTFSIPSIYPALSIKDSPRNPRFSLSPPTLPFIWDKKDEEERAVTMEEQHAKGKKRQELGRKRMDGTGHERGTVRASVDWLYRRAAPPTELGEVYSREIRLIIRLINWPASICRTYRSRRSQFNWSLARDLMFIACLMHLHASRWFLILENELYY